MSETDKTVLFSKRSFSLLEELEANNHREWYQAHKIEFAEHLLDPFAAMLEVATKKLTRNRIPFKGDKKTMFRMNRDVRFSENKDPYKLHVGGMLTPSGTKDEMQGVVYSHIEKQGGLVAAGFYRPEKEQLHAIRARIVSDEKTFAKILTDLSTARLELNHDEKLKRMPRDFTDYADHPHADYLKLKGFTVWSRQPKKVWLDGTIVDELVRIAKSSTPLIQFCAEAK